MKAVREAEKQRIKVTKVILWKEGPWCVVEGPFPDGFIRGETRTSVDRARKIDKYYVVARPATHAEGWFCLCHTQDVIPVLGGENEFGPVCP